MPAILMSMMLFQAAAASPPAGNYITDPIWRPLNMTHSLAPYYPPGAFESGIDGAAIVDCLVGREGSLSDCRVVVEGPQDQGFGPAAASLAPMARLASATASGHPSAGRRVKAAIRFRLPWSPPDSTDDRALITVSPISVYAKKPSAEDFARSYPERAQRKNIEGRATLHCRVADNGALDNCSATDDAPADQNFADAALALSRLFQIDIKRKPGNFAIGKQVTIPLRWVLPGLH